VDLKRRVLGSRSDPAAGSVVVERFHCRRATEPLARTHTHDRRARGGRRADRHFHRLQRRPNSGPARPRPAGHPAPIMVIGVIDSVEEEHTALADDWLVTLSIADTAFLAFSERDFESGEAQPGYRRSVSDRPPTQPSAASKTPPARDGTPLPGRRSLASLTRESALAPGGGPSRSSAR